MSAPLPLGTSRRHSFAPLGSAVIREPRFVFRRTLNPGKAENSSDSSTVVESLMPKVIRLDAEGVPVSEHETASVAKEVVDVEVIGWQRWKASQITAQMITNAKSLVFVVPELGSSTSKCPRFLWPF